MAEEPPYLQVGTEVSAKYKGAFCEAKIKAVKILVKCRVNYGKGNLATINNEMIKGSLKPGSKVEAKHSDGTYHPATIIRVTDASVYTVVFDDGDECTLRRSSLCLQGARHFKESQTLDQLPLTDPENFGNPVMLSGKRRRRHVSESSDDESEESYQAKKMNISRDYPIGTVMFLENDRRKSSWLPVVIVPAKCCMEESSQSPHQICVRSFRDGRFYTAEPGELHEFSEEKEPLLSVINGDLHHTHKQAIDKAMTYMSTQELPWDMDIPQKKQQQQQKKQQQQQQKQQDVVEAPSPSTPKVEETPEQDDEEREKFLTVLKQFHLDRGTPMTRPPVLSQKTLDLYRLYQLVQEYGGMEKVTQDMKWKYLYNKLGLSSQITSASYSLKMAYKKHLFPFEEHQRINNNKGDATDDDDTSPMINDTSPIIKPRDQQSGDEECGSTASTRSSNVDQEANQSGPPANHDDDTTAVTEENDMDTTESNNIHDSESNEEKSSAPSAYTVGEKIKVWYGKGKFLKSYVAKIMDSTMESGIREYYVHYSGWNARYDEWVSEDKVAARLAAGSNERTRPSTAKNKQSPKNRRGRPPHTFGPPDRQSHPPPAAQHGKATKQQQQKTTTVRESPAKPSTSTSGEGSKPSSAPSGRGPGRPKKKRSPPVPVAVSPEVTAAPPITAPVPAPPSPPPVAAKAEAKVNHAIPPSPPSNKDTATAVEDDTKDDTMNIDNVNATSREQVKSHSDATTTEPLVPSEPVVVESVKKETVEEKVPSPPSPPTPPSPPKPVEPVVPVEPLKQKSPSPAPPSPPRAEVTPPPVLTTPIKEEVHETREDTVGTPQGSAKKKRGTPDGKKKAKASLQERRREQASDWIVDFSKMPELDSAGRIAILTEKIGAIQKRYAELKAEVAYLDRKKRRAKQREREAIRNNQSQTVVECQ